MRPVQIASVVRAGKKRVDLHTRSHPAPLRRQSVDCRVVAVGAVLAVVDEGNGGGGAS